jgi:chromosomal replication initiation ATPase DnaA
MKNEQERSVSSAVSTLLKNISDGLSVLSIDELNRAISEILVKKKEKTKDVEQLIEIVCKEFKISQKALKEKYSRNNIYSAKIILFVIMNKHIGMSKRSIAKLFDTFPNSVNVAVIHFEQMNPEKFKDDKDFLVIYQKCLTSFLQKIS